MYILPDCLEWWQILDGFDFPIISEKRAVVHRKKRWANTVVRMRGEEFGTAYAHEK